MWSYYPVFFGGSLTMPNPHVSIFLPKKRVKILNLTFWKGNQMSISSRGALLLLSSVTGREETAMAYDS